MLGATELMGYPLPRSPLCVTAAAAKRLPAAQERRRLLTQIPENQMAAAARMASPVASDARIK